MSELVVGEMPPNWLSEIFRECRKIERLVPFFERIAEQNCIVEKIKRHPKGQRMGSHPSLSHVVSAALGVANEVERRQKQNPMPGPGPDTSAARFVSDELDIPIE